MNKESDILNLQEAIELVLAQAEESTYKEAVVCGKKIKAIQIVKNFYKDYGHFFSQYKEIVNYDRADG